MFEVAELGRKRSKAQAKADLEALRPRMVALGQRLRGSKRGVVVLVGGVEGAGKSEVINRLTEWLDPRGVDVASFWNLSDEDLSRPSAWRAWRRLPARGRIGIFFGSWYTQPIIDAAHGALSRPRFDAAMARIRQLEQELSDDGYTVIKLWFHLDEATLRRRISDAADARKRDKDAPKRDGDEPDSGRGKGARQRAREALRMSPLAKKFRKRYEEFVVVSERALRATHTAEAPWHIIEATDPRHRDLCAAEILVDTVEAALDGDAARTSQRLEAAITARLDLDAPSVLDRVDLTATLSDDAYEARIAAAQDRLYRLAWQAHERGIATVVAFEGWDAAGKGGAIRRLLGGLDARLVQVVPIAAPTDEERAHPWMWRFWRRLPADGQMVVFDRTWYGRVLVERIEGFAATDAWQRAFGEITAFEQALLDHGNVLVKCWLHISPEEQLRRFEERQQIAWKQYKITDEDWRNRERWGHYRAAVHDMVGATSTVDAPWTLVAADCKRNARVQVVEAVAEALARRLG